MLSPWLWLAGAGLMEVAFTTSLKFMNNDPVGQWPWLVSFVVSAGLSFACMSQAMAVLPMGTVYAVWTGLGALGTALVGMMWFGDPVSIARSVFLGLLVMSVLGLKWLS